MRKSIGFRRACSMMLAFVMLVTTVFAGWMPVAAAETAVSESQDADVTLTVIGDTGNHSSGQSGHTGYVYWVKDMPLDIDVDALSDTYVAKNCGDEIRNALAESRITAEFSDETSLYPSSLVMDGTELTSDLTSGAYWSVIVVYADGTSDSNGWGEYNGAAELKEGCRLIYYWSDDVANDCRLGTDDDGNTVLNYDTDAVTGISLYTEKDSSQAASAISFEAGQTSSLIAKLTVPEDSEVDRTLTWSSSNPQAAAVTATANGAVVTGKSAGTAVITASMINTLGEKLEASCTIYITANGTVITGMNFAEGTELSMEPGDMEVLTPVYTPALGNDETAPAPVWTSSDESVVWVDSASGEMEAVAPGNAVITATIMNNRGETVTASCTVTVAEVALKGIALTTSSLNMKQSETKELSLRFTPANATQIPEITWESSNTAVATVIGNGETATVTAMSGGTAKITAKTGSYTASCDVTVETAEEITMLTDLIFAADADGENIYAMESALDPETRECTVIIPENVSIFYLKPVLAGGVTAEIQAQYKNYSDSKDLTKDLAAGEFTGFLGSERLLKSGQTGKDMTIAITAGTYEQTYTVHVVREALVKSLKLTDDNGAELLYTPDFSPEVREYEIKVVDSVESINLTFTAYSTESNLLTVNGETAENGIYTLKLTGNETEALIRACKDSVIPAVYKLTVKRVTAGSYRFTVDPADAIVAVYDSNGVRQWAEDGAFSVLPDETYTYNITRNGYVSQSGTFIGSGVQTVALKAVSEVAYKQFESDWHGLRNDENNQGITNAKTPIYADSIALKWENQYGEGVSSSAVSPVILVDDKLYCYAADTLMVISKETGEILKSAKMAGRSSFAINPPTYANGMIFVGLAGGIQAFNAETLESLWVYKDALGGQPNCSIRYDDGYVYTGFWNSETRNANWVCLSVADEDTAQTTELKTATWTYAAAGGFYWAGAYTNEKYLIVGSDDGTNSYDSESSYVYVFDKYTGKVIQKVGPCIGDIRSEISYYNGRIYFTTKAGYLYSYILTEDGLIDTAQSIAPLKVGEMSTSTPVVYNDRLYVGVTYGANFSGTYAAVVVDIDPETGAMTEAYNVPTNGYPQTSGMLTTAYEEEDGCVYVYFTVNSANGELYVIKDKKGMTEASEDSGILYVPNHKQYCICSVVADKDGNIYFKNDSAYLMALTYQELTLEGANVSGGNAAFYKETIFDVSMREHEIVVDPGTEKILLSLDAEDGFEDAMNGESGIEQEINLENGTATIEVVLSSGSLRSSYTFTVRERSANTALTDLMATTSVSADTAVTILPEMDANVKEYSSEYEKSAVSMYIWMKQEDENAVVSAEAVSGVFQMDAPTTVNGYTRYRIFFEDTSNVVPAVIKITVTAEDGKTVSEYQLTLGVKASDEVKIEDIFTDVGVNTWYYDYITYIYRNGIMTGITDTEFVPEGTLTRAQMAMVLYRLEDTPDVEYSGVFRDVKDEYWYTDAIMWAAESKIVDGYSEGLYGPDMTITREQMIVMMYRYANYKKYEISGSKELSRFTDANKVSGYALEAMKWAVGNGIIDGKYEGIIEPQSSITRAECATILMRFMEMFR